MTALLVDLSHYNTQPDWAALKAGGVSGVILKASEGTGYADPVFVAWRAAAHAAGLAVGMYGFADLGSPAAEAAWFAQVVGALAPGEFVGLDEEVTRTGVDPVVWAGQWIDALATHGIGTRLLYINKSFLAAHDWSPIVARGVLLWLADYDGSTTVTGPSGPWPTVTLKQFTDAASVSGEAGQVDEDVLFGPLTVLTGGVSATSGGFLMALTDAEQAELLDRVRGVSFATPGTPNVDSHYVPLDSQRVVGVLDTVTALAAQVTALAGQVSALQTAVAGLPAATAQALPSMTCQGNPKAVLSVIGQAATAAAASAP